VIALIQGAADTLSGEKAVDVRAYAGELADERLTDVKRLVERRPTILVGFAARRSASPSTNERYREEIIVLSIYLCTRSMRSREDAHRGAYGLIEIVDHAIYGADADVASAVDQDGLRVEGEIQMSDPVVEVSREEVCVLSLSLEIPLRRDVDALLGIEA